MLAAVSYIQHEQLEKWRLYHFVSKFPPTSETHYLLVAKVSYLTLVSQIEKGKATVYCEHTEKK